MIKYISALFLVVISYTLSLSQSDDNRMSEEEISFQDKFIEAKSYILLDDPEKAEDILVDLYKDDRNSTAVALELASLYEKTGKPNNELKYAKIASQNSFGNQNVLSTYGAICLRLEEYNEAQITYKKLVEASPSNELYTDKYATALLYLNKEKEAIKAYDELESNIGVTEDVSRRKIEILDILGDKKSMIVELQKLIESDPENIVARHNLATTYINIGNQNEANEIYKSIVSIDPNDTKANIALMGDADEPTNDGSYLRALNPIVDNDEIPINNKVLELIPFTTKLAADPSNKELSGALNEISQRLVAIHPQEAKSHAIRGDILYIIGNNIDAVKAYEKTLAIDDSVYDVWEQLFYALSELEEYNKLAYKSEMAIDLFPNKASAFYMCGLANRNISKNNLAIEYLSEGIFVSGKDKVLKSKILTELALSYVAENNIKQASKYIDLAITESNQQYALALLTKADILKKLGNSNEANEYYKKASTLGSSKSK